MATETLMGRNDPVLNLRGTRPVRGALSVLRELRDELGLGWDIPMEFNPREMIRRRARAAARRVVRFRIIWPAVRPWEAPSLRVERSSPAQPTDIPLSGWVAPVVETTVLPDTPRNAVRNRAWNVDWFRGRMNLRISSLDIAAKWAKAYRDVAAAVLEAREDGRAIDLCAQLGVWSDYIDCFGGMPTKHEMGLAEAKREEAAFAALAIPDLALVA